VKTRTFARARARAFDVIFIAIRRLAAGGAMLLALLLGIGIDAPRAHEGHDHEATAPKIAVPAAPRAEATSDEFELVAVAQGGELSVYLDRFASNEPVVNASIELDAPAGRLEAKPAADGTYRAAAAWLTRPGRYDLIATVRKDDVEDVLAFTLDIPAGNPAATSLASAARQSGIHWNDVLLIAVGVAAGAVAGIIVGRRRRTAQLLIAVAVGAALSVNNSFAHEGADHSHDTPAAGSPGSRNTAQILSDGSVFVPKSSQRILAIRTVKAETGTYRRSIELPGRVIPDPNASGFVQTAVGGRLSPPDGGFPRLGTRVRKGDILAYVTAPLQAIDVSTMRQQQGDLEQQISIVERRVIRYESLAPSGAVARSQLEDARLELEGLKARRASLDKVRQEPEALVAPVDGIVAEGTPVAGQIAQTNGVVFHIIDPSRLWIEALSYESLPALQSGTARSGQRELRLEFRGAGFADRNQSIPIHFAVSGDTSGIRAGQFVTVFAETPEEQRGIALPRSSVVRNASGQDSVYEHVSAERFEQRRVRIEPLDGQRILVAEGLEPGRRIVVQGAELIEHIR
jgi:RND family efflux transporter MFP subunit